MSSNQSGIITIPAVDDAADAAAAAIADAAAGIV
jgi:hypothetical protein